MNVNNYCSSEGKALQEEKLVLIKLIEAINAKMKRVSTDASVSGYNHAKLVQAPLATQKEDAVLSTVT